jgi:hypothetical protein
MNRRLRSSVVPGKFERIGRRRTVWCRKAEPSGRWFRNTKEAPPWNLCITSGWMCTRKISYCVKDRGGKVYSEGSLTATHLDLDVWVKTLPQPWSAAMEEK